MSISQHGIIISADVLVQHYREQYKKFVMSQIPPLATKHYNPSTYRHYLHYLR
jgi:hypothetical protein